LSIQTSGVRYIRIPLPWMDGSGEMLPQQVIDAKKDFYLESPALNFYGAAAVRRVDGMAQFAVIDDAQGTQWHPISDNFFDAFVAEFGAVQMPPTIIAEPIELTG
jgi:hypothetical protein